MPRLRKHRTVKSRVLASKPCKDYDDDCKDANHLKCFLGGTIIINGEKYTTPMCDGYCPFLNTPN